MLCSTTSHNLVTLIWFKGDHIYGDVNCGGLAAINTEARRL